MFKKFLMGLGLLIVLLGAPVFAQEKEVCKTFQDVKTMSQTLNLPSVKVDKDMIDIFVVLAKKYVETLEGPAADSYDSGLFVQNGKNGMVMLFLFKDNCVVGAFTMSQDLFTTVINDIAKTNI